MRNTILISLLVFIIVAGGAYCIAWYTQAAQTRQAIEHIVANINGTQHYLSYDAIETSGFPSDVVVSVVRPHFVGRVDALLKSLTPPPSTLPPGQPLPFANLPEWNEDDTLDGRLIFTVNALSDHYGFAMTGNWQQNSKVGGQTVATASQPAGDFVCTLQMQRSAGFFANMWSYGNLGHDPQAFFRDFRMLDCANHGYALIDRTTNEKLLSAGPGRIFISSDPKGDREQMRVYVKSSDGLVTPQGDRIIAAYMQAFAPDRPMPVAFSSYGSQNVDIDFSYNGPIDWQGAKNPAVTIDLSKFSVANLVYTVDASFHLNNGMTADIRSAKLAFRSEATFSEQYDALMQNVVHNLILQAYANNDPKFAQLQPYLQQYAPDQTYAIIYPIIPGFHSLGKLVQAVDVSYQGNTELNAGDVNLADLELSAAPYGISGKGSAKLTAGQPIPVANVTLACTNCLHLIDDATGYAGRVQKAVSYFNPGQAAAMTVDPQLVEAYKSFIAALAQQSADKTIFTYVIDSGAAGISINGKNLNQVMVLYNEYVTPALKQHAAQSAAPH